METLKKTYQFDRVYRRGKSYGNKQLVMYILQNKKGQNFFGIVISKKIGKSVKRNRIRRQITEVLRLKNNIKIGQDIVIVVRQQEIPLDYKTISKSIDHLLKKHGLLI